MAKEKKKEEIEKKKGARKWGCGYSQGFTLIELLLVIGIIVIIAAAVFVALNPARRLGEANNAKRWSDVTAILNAVHQYSVDHGGSFPNSSSWTAGNYYVLGTNRSGCNSGCTAQRTQRTCLNLTDLTSNNYLSSIPQDPVSGSAGFTDYYIQRTSGGIVTVGACDPYGSDAISVSR